MKKQRYKSETVEAALNKAIQTILTRLEVPDYVSYSLASQAARVVEAQLAIDQDDTCFVSRALYALKTSGSPMVPSFYLKQKIHEALNTDVKTYSEAERQRYSCP